MKDGGVGRTCSTNDEIFIYIYFFTLRFSYLSSVIINNLIIFIHLYVLIFAQDGNCSDLLNCDIAKLV
jgi:hypothetical protein